MSDTFYVIGEDTLGDIADSIRTKKGYSSDHKIAVDDFASEIASAEPTVNQVFDKSNEAKGTIDLVYAPNYTNANQFLGCTSLKSVVTSNLTGTMETGWLKNCTELESVTTNSNYLYSDCFSGCSKLKRLNSSKDGLFVIPKDAGNYAFNNCILLEEAKLSNFSVNAPSGLFSGCTNLKTVLFGPNVGGFGSGDVFKNCPSLTSIVIKKLTKVQYSALPFTGTTVKANITIYVPASLLSTYQSDSSWSGAGFKAIEAITDTLTIGSSSYTCNEGESFAEWVASANNTDGFVVVGNMIYNAAKTAYVTKNGSAVYPYDIISTESYALTNL